MRCPHCNEKNASNTPFCQNCGKWILEERYVEPKTKRIVSAKAKEQRRLNPFVCGILILAVACIFTLLLWPDAPITPEPTTQPQINVLPTVTTTPPETISPPTTLPPTLPPTVPTTPTQPEVDPGPERIPGDYLYATDELVLWPTATDTYALIVNDRLFEVDKYTLSQSSIDRKAIAYLLQDGRLMMMRADWSAPVQVAADVSDFALSLDGTTLAYLRVGDLYRYHASEAVHEHIDTTFYTNISNLTISYDGSAIAFYAKMHSAYNVMLITYTDRLTVLEKFSTATISTVSHLISVSDDGAICQIGTTGAYSAYVSCDGKQMLLADNYGTFLYRSHDDEAPQKISDLKLMPIYPAQTLRTDRGEAHFFPAESLLGQYYYARPYGENNTVFYLELDGTLRQVASDIVQTWLDPTGNFLYCRDASGELTRIQTKDLSSETILSGVENFAVSNDCTSVYYLNDLVIYRKAQDGVIETVTRLFDFKQFIIAADGRLYYNDGMGLYAHGSPFDGPVLEDPSLWFLGPNGRIYAITSDNRFYVSCDDGHMEQLFYTEAP